MEGSTPAWVDKSFEALAKQGGSGVALACKDMLESFAYLGSGIARAGVLRLRKAPELPIL
ncbi:hypothetical protein C7U62_02650 [Mesorhizobium loti]|nr:hypothetical protein C7U62_02650 [Mesorhizobium loti]GEC36470.1 hypothetical protein EME01_05420 [Sinorhizobium meliloti]